MKLFNNMKISVKILSSFIVVLLLLSIVGIIGINSINKINYTYTEMYENNVKAFIYISNVLEGFERQRINSRNILLSRNKDEMNRYIQEISEIDQFYKSNLQLFEKTIKENDISNEYNKLKVLQVVE
ncbi:MCP four helix bundle domain-containing protein [Caldicellulosiruptor saccharolyticus]|uniref:MCP four helix bundle domain-containing protein n=1 Tax=Caldicellulosiruptor saccharolyticus TaxID=44001 RepID=UPI00005E4C4F|nr:MCP four helix bundle domain-containing protein [Caldicellulosiruptor saccharolyticus]